MQAGLVTMDAYTDLPGVQFYAGNFIDPADRERTVLSYGNRLCAVPGDAVFSG